MENQNKKIWFILGASIIILFIIFISILSFIKNSPTNEEIKVVTDSSKTDIPTEENNSSNDSTPVNESTGTISASDTGWSFQINGIEKSTKFSDVYSGYQKPITLIIEDPVSGAIILQVQDFTSKSTNLNELVPDGTEYYLRFYDATGALMEPAWPNVKTTH
ncbi:hypothetical protein H6790_02845 [Candidatus Nomurabacteria bacterium]|nr:hypothetical protein [Candidatus Nomurabacteria bacterium]